MPFWWFIVKLTKSVVINSWQVRYAKYCGTCIICYRLQDYAGVGFDISSLKDRGEGDKRCAFPNIFFGAVASVVFAF